MISMFGSEAMPACHENIKDAVGYQDANAI